MNRAEHLKADTKPQWGRFTASAMLAHLNDSYRMATGELKVKPRRGPLKYTPIKQLIIYVLPFPKGAPTAPELLARGDRAQLDDERLAFARMFDQLGKLKPGDALQPHPAFGALSYDEYGALMAKHTQHHFRQFGI
ncbi:MAG TPA: DUF1569 domain-containing protein [Vicinamibacterales bacterium]